MKDCPLCARPIAGLGNNAHPFEGRCCDECDAMFVTPARIMDLEPSSEGFKLIERFVAHGRTGRQILAAVEGIRQREREDAR